MSTNSLFFNGHVTEYLFLTHTSLDGSKMMQSERVDLCVHLCKVVPRMVLVNSVTPLHCIWVAQKWSRTEFVRTTNETHTSLARYSSGYGIELHILSQVWFPAATANTGWMTIFGWANLLSISPSHPGQLSLLPSAGREMSTNQSVVTLCGWVIKAGVAHSTCG